LKIDSHDLAGNARFHIDGSYSLDIADTCDFKRHICSNGRDGTHRYRLHHHHHRGLCAGGALLCARGKKDGDGQQTQTYEQQLCFG
jgi:hypothetical protein